jgi:uncharacterized protein YjiS (DUF1127 family)
MIHEWRTNMSTHEKCLSAPRATYPVASEHVGPEYRLVDLFRAVVGHVTAKRRQRMAAAHLSSLPDYQLRDIGIDRASIADVVIGHKQLKDRLGR